MNVATYYRQVSNINRTLVGNKIVDHSDVVGASPVGAAPTTSSFSTTKDNCKTRRESSKFCDLVRLILETLRYILRVYASPLQWQWSPQYQRSNPEGYGSNRQIPLTTAKQTEARNMSMFIGNYCRLDTSRSNITRCWTQYERKNAKTLFWL